MAQKFGSEVYGVMSRGEKQPVPQRRTRRFRPGWWILSAAISGGVIWAVLLIWIL